MTEFNVALNFRRVFLGGLRVTDLRLGVEDVVQPSHGRTAPLKYIGDESERDHGKYQARHKIVKCDELAEGNPVHDNKTPALPKHQHKRQADQHLKQRHEQAPEVDQTQVAIDIFAVRRVETTNLSFFLSVGAHDAHAREVFLRLRGEHRQRSLDLSIERMNLLAENPNDNGDDGDGK